MYQKWMSDIAKMDVRHFGCHMSQMDVRHFGCHILTMDVFYFKNGCQTFQKWMSHISKTDVRHFGCRMSKMDVRHFGCHISKMDVKHFKNGCPSHISKMDVRHSKMDVFPSFLYHTSHATCVLCSSVAMATSALPPQGARSNPAAACVMCLVASLRSPPVGGMLPGRGPPRHPS